MIRIVTIGRRRVGFVSFSGMSTAGPRLRSATPPQQAVEGVVPRGALAVRVDRPHGRDAGDALLGELIGRSRRADRGALGSLQHEAGRLVDAADAGLGAGAVV